MRARMAEEEGYGRMHTLRMRGTTTNLRTVLEDYISDVELPLSKKEILSMVPEDEEIVYQGEVCNLKEVLSTIPPGIYGNFNDIVDEARWSLETGEVPTVSERFARRLRYEMGQRLPRTRF